MSDEPTPTPPPSLRLKPRIRPDVPATPPPSIPKIAIAQPLDADGVLSAGDRKVFSAPAPGLSATAGSETPAVESEPAAPKKISLTAKLAGESAPKRFTVPASAPSPGTSVKRIPLPLATPIPPTPGSGEDGPPHEDDDSSSAEKTSFGASTDDVADEASNHEATHAGSAESESSVTDSAPAETEERDATDSHEESDADGYSPAAESLDSDEPHSTTPHPAADVPTRFSPPPSEGAEGGRFKLKPRLSAPENAPQNGGVSLPSSIPGTDRVAPPGIKIVPTAPAGPSSGSLPAKVALQPRAAADGTRRVRRVVVKSEKPRILKFLLISFGILAGLGLAVGGFMVFRNLSQLEKHPAVTPEVVAHVPVKKAPSQAATPKEVAAPQSAAGKLIAQATAAANAQIEEVDSVTAEATSPAAAGTVNASSAHPAASAGQTPAAASASANPTSAVTAATASQTQVALKPVVHGPVIKKISPPSAEFRALIVNLRVSGVFQGEHPRALLNGRLMNAGEILDQSMLVRFTGIDAVHKQLLFEDGTGAIMQRHY